LPASVRAAFVTFHRTVLSYNGSMDLEDVGISLLFGRLWNVQPKVQKVANKLVARSDWKAQLWNLGSSSRSLEVDPVQKVVRLAVRRFWFVVSRRRIEFDWIQQVGYRYAEMSPSWGAHQQADLYTVDLLLKNGEYVVLFRFFGEGDFVNNSIWPDWMYWEQSLIADYTRGDQEKQSVLFVDLLSRMIGVPVVQE